MREEFVTIVYVDAWCGNIFRPCKSLKSRVIGQTSSGRGKTPWNSSRGGPTRDAMSRQQRTTRKGTAGWGRTGEQKASKKDWNPKEVSEGALSWYIHNSSLEEIGWSTRSALNLNFVCCEFNRSSSVFENSYDSSRKYFSTCRHFLWMFYAHYTRVNLKFCLRDNQTRRRWLYWESLKQIRRYT